MVNSFSYAQDPFADLVEELLGEGSFDGTVQDDVNDDWGFRSSDDDDIKIRKFDDKQLMFEFPAVEKDGDIITNYAVTVMPVKGNDIDQLFEDDDFYENIDLYEERVVSATITEWDTATIAIEVADTNDTMYLTIYPLDGNEKGNPIEDFKIDPDDDNDNSNDLTDELEDCLDKECDDKIDQVSCSVNEENYRAKLTWNDLGGDDLEIYMKEHNDNNFELEDTVDASDEKFEATLPKKTSFLFLLKPVNRDGGLDGTEVTYLCKFTEEEKKPSAPPCVWSDCVAVTPKTWPETAMLILFAITFVLYMARRKIKK